MTIATRGFTGKTIQEDLLVLIDLRLAGLLADQPQLGELVQYYTEQELKGQIVELFRRLDRGLPVAVPEIFQKKTRQVQQSPGWSELLILLRDWESEGALGGAQLEEQELESLALGLLWGTMLIGRLAS